MFAINRGSTGSNRMLILLGGETAQDGKVLIYDDNPQAPYFDIVSSTIVGNLQCHHVAYVKDGSTGFLYVNGASSGSHSIDYQISSNDQISLGQEWDNSGSTPSDFYQGILDEVRIWNYARTEQEISLDKAHALVGTESGLIALFSMDDGVAGADNMVIDTLDDATQNYNGEMIGFVMTGDTSNFVEQQCFATASMDFMENTGVVKLYPNPFTEHFVIDAPFSIYSIKILNVQGEQVYSELINNQKTQEVIFQGSRGMYLIQVSLNNGGVYQEKVLKY
ncbi:MAG: T9SS type A sorting domain-containing protein [Bacteroidia bacterium]